MKKVIKVSIYLLTLMALVSPINTNAKLHKNYKRNYAPRSYAPNIQLAGKWGFTNKGSKRNIARLGVVIPVMQKMGKSVTYLSLIGMGDTNKHFEGNFGAGHREIINGSWIIGGYGFYDIRYTQNDNKLQQVTLGLEALSKNLEIRGNVYLPISKAQSLGHNNIYEINFDNTRNAIILKGSQQEHFEKAMRGFDVETGGSLPLLSKFSSYIAFYHFTTNNASSNTGLRIRANYDVTRWLAFEGETNYDKDKKITTYVGAKLSWNFGSTKAQPINSLDNKMVQLPVRDVDIVSAHVSEKPVESMRAEIDADLKMGIIVSDDSAQANTIIKIGENVDISVGDNVKNLGNKVKAKNGSIDDILLISSNGDKIQSVGDSLPGRKADKSTLNKYKIQNIDKEIVSKSNKSGKSFKYALAMQKIDHGKMTAGEALDLKWIGLEDALRLLDNSGSRINIIIAAINQGKTRMELMKNYNFTRNEISEAINIMSRDPKFAIDRINTFNNEGQNVSISITELTGRLSAKLIVEHFFDNDNYSLTEDEVEQFVKEINQAIDNLTEPLTIDGVHSELHPDTANGVVNGVHISLLDFQKNVLKRAIKSIFIDDKTQHGFYEGAAQNVELGTHWASVWRALRPYTNDLRDNPAGGDPDFQNQQMARNAKRDTNCDNIILDEFFKTLWDTKREYIRGTNENWDYTGYSDSCYHGKMQRANNVAVYLTGRNNDNSIVSLSKLVQVAGMDYAKPLIEKHIETNFPAGTNEVLFRAIDEHIEREVGSEKDNSLSSVEQMQKYAEKVDEITNVMRGPSKKYVGSDGNNRVVPGNVANVWVEYYDSVIHFVDHDEKLNMGNYNVLRSEGDQFNRMKYGLMYLNIPL